MLKGKRALVTGASRGIGRAVAISLAQAGADVAVNDIKFEDSCDELTKIIEGYGNRVGVYTADIANRQQVSKMIDEIAVDFGGIDILINNAGISPKHGGLKKPIYEMEPDEWERVIQVNLTGAFYCTRYVAPIMIKGGWGRIVNISSMAARVYSPIPGAHYCASKAGIRGLTWVCAGELAKFNILVNAVAPGRIYSQMMAEIGDEYNREILKTVPIGKFGEVEDVSSLIKFLVSEENTYIVGATIDINGGRAML